jgi:DNA-directed RNA polymerase specialized sigma24 family protein
MPDQTETERLFRVYHEQMIALAIALLHDEEEARDTVSDVMERLVKGTLHLREELIRLMQFFKVLIHRRTALIIGN